MVLKTKVIVGHPEDDRSVHVSLTHINSIELLQTT
jgi:hypothetical protein